MALDNLLVRAFNHFKERGLPAMPNRTIYVADADLPIFEKAQELAGDNLSATIAQALHRFVEAEEARGRGFEEVTVKVGKITHSYKRFRGRLLAKGRVREQNDFIDNSFPGSITNDATKKHGREQNNPWDISYDITINKFGSKAKASEHNDARDISYRVYQTAKGKLALYVRNLPNWNYWSSPGSWSYRNYEHRDWSYWPQEEQEFRFEVYDTVEQLAGNVPQELYETVIQALRGDPDGVEFLDI